MRKIFYLILTFFICYILKLGDVWLGFAPVLLFLNLFKFEDSFLWEIPLAALSCGVLESAFVNELDTLLKIFLPCGAVFIAYNTPKRLVIFFPVAIWAIFNNNIYALCAMTASVWYGVRSIVKKPSVTAVFYHKNKSFTR